MRLADKNVTEVAHDGAGRIGDYTWAPIGNTLAWSMTDSDEVSSSVYVWQASEGKLHRVTTSTFNEFNPAWDPDGNYIYYLSNRFYEPQISQDEFNYATVRQTGIFALALRKNVKNPFPMENDEVSVDTSAARPAASLAPAPGGPAPTQAGAPKAMDPQEIRIDFDGIEKRVARVPIEADNISRLVATKTALALRRQRRAILLAAERAAARAHELFAEGSARRASSSTTPATSRCRATRRS